MVKFYTSNAENRTDRKQFIEEVNPSANIASPVNILSSAAVTQSSETLTFQHARSRTGCFAVIRGRLRQVRIVLRSIPGRIVDAIRDRINPSRESVREGAPPSRESTYKYGPTKTSKLKEFSIDEANKILAPLRNFKGDFRVLKYNYKAAFRAFSDPESKRFGAGNNDREMMLRKLALILDADNISKSIDCFKRNISNIVSKSTFADQEGIQIKIACMDILQSNLNIKLTSDSSYIHLLNLAEGLCTLHDKCASLIERLDIYHKNNAAKIIQSAFRKHLAILEKKESLVRAGLI